MKATIIVHEQTLPRGTLVTAETCSRGQAATIDDHDRALGRMVSHVNQLGVDNILVVDRQKITEVLAEKRKGQERVS